MFEVSSDGRTVVVRTRDAAFDAACKAAMTHVLSTARDGGSTEPMKFVGLSMRYEWQLCRWKGYVYYYTFTVDWE